MASLLKVNEIESYTASEVTVDDALIINETLAVTGASTLTGLVTGTTGFSGPHNGTVGATTPAAGTFTSLNATGGGALTGTWSNLGTVTTIDINGGTVDGTIIGGSSVAAGSFARVAGQAGTGSSHGFSRSNSGNILGIDDGTISANFGTDGTNFYLSSNGTAAWRLTTGTLEQARIAHTAAAVNYVNLTGGILSNPVRMSAAGSDTNIGLQISGKGNQGVTLLSGAFSRIITQFNEGSASADRYITITSSNGGNPIIATNAGNLAITPTIVAAAAITVGTTLTVTGAFGCNAATAQTAFASGGALNAYGAGANGFDSGANASALHALVVAIRAALVANGIMS